jgi:4-hydroxybenzoate polyprenyltransferase
MIHTLRKLVLVSRPISWPNTAYPFAAGYVVCGGSVSTVWLLATLYFLFPYNLLMYGVNDVFDYESDIRNPRKGGIEGMREQKQFHPTIIKACVITNVPILAILLATQGLVPALVLLALTFFVLAYSVAYLRFKERPVLDSITSSIHFVGPLVYALSLLHWPTSAWPFVAAFFLWGMASHAFGAVQDIIPDKKADIASIATVLGAATTVRFAFVLYVLAAVIIAAQNIGGLVIALCGLLYAINIQKYLFISEKESFKTNRAWRRFIWLNMFTGFVVTVVLIFAQITN